MTDAQEALRQVCEALAAGPSPGEWRISKYRDGQTALIYDADDFGLARVYYPNRDANAALIAACSPANIAAILAYVEAQKAEIKRLRKLAMSTHLFEEAPCFLCGYNGPGYYQPEQHPCAALYHEAMEEQR